MSREDGREHDDRQDPEAGDQPGEEADPEAVALIEVKVEARVEASIGEWQGGDAEEHEPRREIGESTVASEVSESVALDSESFPTGPQPIGAYLRRQRILRGIDVEELSASTRIPVRSLERLEAGHFDGDVDGFVRGFVRTVAEGLGLDPEDTIARMLREPTAADYAPGEPSPSLRRAVAGLALLLMLGLAVGLVRAVTLALSSASERAEAEAVVYWRDPVQALAEANAADRVQEQSEQTSR